MSFEKVSATNELLSMRCRESDHLKGSAFSIERLLAPSQKRFEDNHFNQQLPSINNKDENTAKCVQHCKWFFLKYFFRNKVSDA